ncbi:hypothetical protein [Thermoanaerobacterium thermosaccharolyticum]|uniref:hypothetical protein n=1 Tax=Thermoanaerobacterium thermosaccharolyticum TaxID=1517 RepID=UPI0020A5348B|nr:hypothetical protein [Thermoanaerobacterium thermosaccharolyticum]MCP2239816.1 hypothetical protein [Thermoanaerobacterium thermosaccharolyticum]
MLKKLVSLLLVAVLLSISSFSFAFANDVSKDKITNISSYMTWIKENTNKEEASTFIEQFKSLLLIKFSSAIQYRRK